VTATLPDPSPPRPPVALALAPPWAPFTSSVTELVLAGTVHCCSAPAELHVTVKPRPFGTGAPHGVAAATAELLEINAPQLATVSSATRRALCRLMDPPVSLSA
jgi:hypothetical protein